MPKIIDRKKYTKKLALKAAEVFSAHGYHALGMRQIAKELGISKSALYHYFPSKEALFTACTEVGTAEEVGNLEGLLPPDATMEQRIDALLAWLASFDDRFKNEMSLLIDYLRDKSPAEVAQDPNMNFANNQFLGAITATIGDEHGKIIMLLLYGSLLQRFFDGNQTDFAEIKKYLIMILRP